MSQKQVVNAAVAVLMRGDQVLLAQRPEGKPWAGWWEFPGGKIETGETAAMALQREIQEELGVSITHAYPWVMRSFEYPERHVRLHFYLVRDWVGQPRGMEGQQISWESLASINVAPMLPANEPLLRMLALPPIYGITDYANQGEAFFEALHQALEGGLRFFQIREKQLETDVLSRFVARVQSIAQPYGAQILLNGPVDQARQLGLQGVHLSSAALKVLEVKPEDMIVGVSCHHADDLAKAAALELDFVVLSPVKATLSHPDASPLGWERFSELIAAYALPIYALGGMAAADLQTAWENGAHGIAMQRAIWRAS